MRCSLLEIASATAQRKGMVETALLTSRLIHHLRPKVIVMTGICAGIKKKCNIGDIILANPAWDYQCGKHQLDGEVNKFSIEPHQLDVSTLITTKFTLLAQDTQFFTTVRSKWPNPPSTVLEMKIGPVATGSAVIANPDFVDEIKKQRRDLMGIEMEIYGLYSAAMQASRPLPTTFAIKSVCDFADEKKDDDFQPYACYTAAQTMKEFMERYFHEIKA